MKIVLSVLLVLGLLLSGCAAQPAVQQVEPKAGSWQTWVVTDVHEPHPSVPNELAMQTETHVVHLAAPPNAQATQAELSAVQAAVAGRSAADMQQIAYWDAGSPSYRWIEIAFAQNRVKPAPAPRVMRMMSLLNVAIYDAMVAAWDVKYDYDRPRPAALAPGLAVAAQHTNSPSYPSEHAVAAGAAAAVLGYIYPDLAQEFASKAAAAAQSRVLAGAQFPSDVEAGLELGRHVAEQVILRAKLDDQLAPWSGVIPTGTGHWTGEKPVEPTAGQWQTWVIASGSDIQVRSPLAYDSPELAVELQEVKGFTRTVQSNQKAAYWQSTEGVYENWYNFASLRMFEAGLDANPPAAARIYAQMSVAQHDAIVACWSAKYTYWSFRPEHMDAELGTLFPTPNYPSYPSGLACAATAIAEVIADEFPASAETVRARATEAMESRIWAGIHFRHELTAGQEIGLAVANRVVAHAHETTTLASSAGLASR